MAKAHISRIHGREIIDSRGRPTVEADVLLSDGSMGRASVPSGTSMGRHEAVELRDHDPGRYRGFGVLTAVRHINRTLGPAAVGLDAMDQEGFDARLIKLDSSPPKQHFGSNAVLAVSLAACRAAATARGIPLYRHIADLAGVARPIIPLPMINVISGGLHAGGQLDIQDVLVVPIYARSFAEALVHASEICFAVGERLRAEGHPPLVAIEGGWAPPFKRNEDALAWVADGIASSPYKTAIGMDVAATHLRPEQGVRYNLTTENRQLTGEEMIHLLSKWIDRYPIVSLEDGLGQDDWQAWKSLTELLGHRVQLLADDLTATNPERLQRAIAQRVANGVVVKLNQIGTISEALQVMTAARRAGYRTVASARSGETEDDFLADFAVGTAAGQIKIGSLTRGERLAKYNRLLRIEEELGPTSYIGPTILNGFSNQIEIPRNG